MSKTIVALDCMGGDNAPEAIVEGAVYAADENKNCQNIIIIKKK